MANNKPMLDQIFEVQRELNKQDCFAGTVKAGSSTLYPPQFPPLLKPTPEELLPNQEEMNKLASALTEAVLQLRAGDMDGARATLSDADGLCGVTLYGRNTLTVPDHHMDALRYGMGMSHYQYQPEGPRTATEQLMKQQAAERAMRQAMDSVSSILYPPHIVLDNTADPTDSGV